MWLGVGEAEHMFLGTRLVSLMHSALLLMNLLLCQVSNECNVKVSTKYI